VIEEVLARKDLAHLTMSGDGLGAVHYPAEMSGFGSHAPTVAQDIKTLELSAELNRSGLLLRIAGALDGVNPADIAKANAEIAKLKEQSKPVFAAKWLTSPWQSYAVEAHVPWLWLLVRASPLAARRAAFDPPADSAAD
jgi:hypothetical protein